MADSDEESDKDLMSGINMTGFLFGNIDENGQLEDDILDPEAKQHLASLSRLGLNSFIREMMSNETANEERDYESENKHDDEHETVNERDINYIEKSPNAFDFSDINELAEDLNEDSSTYDERLIRYQVHDLTSSFRIQ